MRHYAEASPPKETGFSPKAMEKISASMTALRIIKGNEHPFNAKTVWSISWGKHYWIHATSQENGYETGISLAFPRELLKQGATLKIGKGALADVRAVLMHPQEGLSPWASEGGITIDTWDESTRKFKGSFWFKTEVGGTEVKSGKVELSLSDNAESLENIKQSLKQCDISLT